MATYKNDYKKDEDPMMWELHNIRSALAKTNRSAEDINNAARIIIKQHNLSGLVSPKSKRLVA